MRHLFSIYPPSTFTVREMKGSEGTEAMVEDWASLPEGILDPIFDRLHYQDWIPFSDVCFHWRTIAYEKFQDPCRERGVRRHLLRTGGMLPFLLHRVDTGVEGTTTVYLQRGRQDKRGGTRVNVVWPNKFLGMVLRAGGWSCTNLVLVKCAWWTLCPIVLSHVLFSHGRMDME